MAKEKKSREAVSLQTQTPNSVVVKQDGQEIVVPTTRQETAFMNMFMAAALRTKIFEELKRWKDLDEHPSPKELADLAKAAKDIASLTSDVVFAQDIEAQEKRVEPEPPAPDVDFSKLDKKKTIDVDATESPETDSSGLAGNTQAETAT